MKITIHRGIDQIGGCITEIATDSTKIFIDLGRNLPKGDKASKDENANIEAIAKLTEGCNAIFYTHYHGDHIDLYKYVPETISQYIGEVAKQVMICKSKSLAKISKKTNVTEQDVAKLEKFKTFKANKSVTIGDITVTPYFVSHSACDAYMFLIESNDGKSILHTGDFREHGYLGKGLEKVLKAFVIGKEIDVLITEGTMLSRRQEIVKHERELKDEATALLEKYKYSFVLCSSTDIDRLASFHDASKKCGKSFFCDKYQKEILDIFSQTAGKKSKLYNFDSALDFQKDKNLFGNKNGFVLVVRRKHFEFIKKVLNCISPEETLLIYSMWDGYINEKVKNGDNLISDYLAIWNLFENRQKLHTSGHATAEILENVCKLVNPQKAIIPIHSEHSADFSKLNISAELKEKIITDSTFKIIKMRQIKGLRSSEDWTEEEKKQSRKRFEEYLSKAPERKAEQDRFACAERENLAKLKEIAEKHQEQGDDDMIHRYLKYFSKCSELGLHEEIPYSYGENDFEKRTGLKDGAHVRYKGISDEERNSPIHRMFWRGHTNPNSILDLETIYEIEHIVIGSSYTLVKLVGFREYEFLGGLFEAINKDEEKKCLNAGGSVRYIGRNEESFEGHADYFCSDPRGVLDLESIYEVEWIGRHPHHCSYRVVKLVGFEKELFHRLWFEKVVN